MTKKLGTPNIVIGGICSLASVLHFSNYIAKEAGPEVDLLRETSAYVQQYQGETPKDVLKYAQKTLAIVGRNDAFSEDTSKLEKELQDIKVQIEESKNQSIYPQDLKNIGGKINDILDDKARSKWSLPCGVVMGALALIYFRKGIYNLCRQKD